MADLAPGEKPKRQASLSLMILAAVVLGVGLGLFGLNYWHATRCAEAHSPAELKEMLDSVSKRLLTAESQTYHNSLLMEKVISTLESRLIVQESSELANLKRHSQDEAVRVALQLASQPSPVRAEFPLDAKYLDAEVLADTISLVLDRVGEEGDEDDKKDDFLLVGGGGGGGGGSGGGVGDGGLWGGGGGGGSSSNGGSSGGGSDGGTAPSDEEILSLCQGWKTKYAVVQGVSWGQLPFDLQGRWLKLKCDIYLVNSSAL